MEIFTSLISNGPIPNNVKITRIYLDDKNTLYIVDNDREFFKFNLNQNGIRFFNQFKKLLSSQESEDILWIDFSFSNFTIYFIDSEKTLNYSQLIGTKTINIDEFVLLLLGIQALSGFRQFIPFQ